MSLADKLVEKYGLDQRVLLVPVSCVDDSPFTVQIAGADPVPARKIAGQTFAVNDVGMALWLPPALPICFKTT